MDNISLPQISLVCRICTKQLSSKQNLKQHMNIHTGEKPYKCTFQGCENSYRHASQLSNHRLVHQINISRAKPNFDDLRAFIILAIEVLEQDEKKEFQVQAGPFTIENSLLPLIGKPQEYSRLPRLDEIIYEDSKVV